MELLDFQYISKYKFNSKIKKKNIVWKEKNNNKYRKFRINNRENIDNYKIITNNNTEDKTKIKSFASIIKKLKISNKIK